MLGLEAEVVPLGQLVLLEQRAQQVPQVVEEQQLGQLQLAPRLEEKQEVEVGLLLVLVLEAKRDPRQEPQPEPEPEPEPEP